MQTSIIFILLLSSPAIIFSRVLMRQDDKSDTIDDIIKASETYAQNASDYLSYPIVFTAEKLNYLANLLPSVFAAQGALAGSAIALPIQLSSSLAAGAASGINGFILSIPIAIGSSINAARGKDLFIRVKPKTQTVTVVSGSHTSKNNDNNNNNNNNNISHNKSNSVISEDNDFTTISTTTLAEDDDYDKAESLIKTLLLKPIAIIVGTKSALSGAGYYFIGKGLEKFGSTLSSIAHSLIFNGNEIRGTGATMFKFATGHKIPLLSANDDLMSAINITKALPESLKEFVFDAISSRKINFAFATTTSERSG